MEKESQKKISNIEGTALEYYLNSQVRLKFLFIIPQMTLIERNKKLQPTQISIPRKEKLKQIK